MRYQGSVGMGGVLSEIGLLASERGYKLPRKELIRGLCERFEVTEHQAMEAIQNTIDARLVIARDNDQIALRDLSLTENPREVRHKHSMEPTGDCKCLAFMVSGVATNVFDDELKKSKGKLVSNKAEAALLVLSHIFMPGVETTYSASLRQLAALNIKKEAEAYKLALAISAKQLEMSPDELETRVREYLESASS